VLTENDVRPRHLLVQAVINHGPGSGHRLLGRLEQHHQRALPLGAGGGQLTRRAQQASDVHVMTTRMHDAIGAARIGQAGLLGHRQGVHVRTQQHRGPIGPILAQHTHDSGTTEAFLDRETLLAQPLSGDSSGSPLLPRQLGVDVQVLVCLAYPVGHHCVHGLTLDRTWTR
jgi:hypothetical protein